MLLKDYSQIFTRLNNLKGDIESLMDKVGQVAKFGDLSEPDDIHIRLFSSLCIKIVNLQRVIKNSGLCEKQEVPELYRKLSVSKNQTRSQNKDEKNSSNQHKKSTCRFNIPTKLDNKNIENNLKGSFPVLKNPETQRSSYSVRSDSKNSFIARTNISVKSRPSSEAKNLISYIDINLEETMQSECKVLYKKMNYFDIIFGLMRLNFVYHDQAHILKRCVIKKDQRVLRPLQVYEFNKDLQVLIGKLAPIIEDNDVYLI